MHVLKHVPDRSDLYAQLSNKERGSGDANNDSSMQTDLLI